MKEYDLITHREIHPRMRVVCGYIVCPCGAWNTRDQWHIETFKNLCYICKSELLNHEKFTGFDGIEEYKAVRGGAVDGTHNPIVSKAAQRIEKYLRSRTYNPNTFDCSVYSIVQDALRDAWEKVNE